MIVDGCFKEWGPFATTTSELKSFLGIKGESDDFDISKVRVHMKTENSNVRVDYLDDKVLMKIPTEGFFIRALWHDKIRLTYFQYCTSDDKQGEYIITSLDVKKMDKELVDLLNSSANASAKNWKGKEDEFNAAWGAVDALLGTNPTTH